MREKLINLINESGACFYCFPLGDLGEQQAAKIADHLIDNGIVIPVRCEDCRYLIDRDNNTYGCYRLFMENCEPRDFCPYGKRRNEEV